MTKKDQRRINSSFQKTIENGPRFNAFHVLVPVDSGPGNMIQMVDSVTDWDTAFRIAQAAKAPSGGPMLRITNWDKLYLCVS